MFQPADRLEQKMEFKVPTDFPTVFECTSGELLFGQVQCIAEGMKSSAHDGINGPTPLKDGGTIRQNHFHYRTAARTGQWKVSRIYGCSQADRADDNSYTLHRHLIGYVLHHVDVSAVDFVRRAAMVGISNGNTHDDKKIVYVNRYDWSWQHGHRAGINVALGSSRPYKARDIDELRGGRLIVLDASHALNFFDAIRGFYPQRNTYSLVPSPDAVPCGIHLGSMQWLPEYELGWLGFSGLKHDAFPESDELVAIVYDPAYTGLEACLETISVEHQVAIEQMEEQLNIDAHDDDDDYVEDRSSDGSSMSEDSASDGGSKMLLNTIDEEEIASLKLPDQLPPPSIMEVSLFSLPNEHAIPPLGLTGPASRWSEPSGRTDVISILGSMLTPANSVSFGSENLDFKVVSNDRIEARPPSDVEGMMDIKVTSPGGTSVGFSYAYTIPTIITKLSPDRGPRWGGNRVVISGRKFIGTTHVMFRNNPVGNGFEGYPAISFDIVSDIRINAVAPAGLPGNCYYVVVHGPDEASGHLLYSYLDTHHSPPSDPHYEAAISTWRWAIQQNSDDWDARFELADVYEIIDDHEAVVALWKETLERHPGNMAAINKLAKAYESKGDFEAMVALWEETTERHADNMVAQDGLAKAYELKGDFEAAIKAWKAAIGLGADDKQILHGLARAYEKNGDKERATIAWNEAAAHWPEGEDEFGW